MDDLEQGISLLAARGRIPVFPLPNVTLFPHATLPLHIFEPRYRRMTRDVLAADRLMAVAQLKPGWETRYYDNPEVHQVACAGIVEDEAALPDGRFNIRLKGLARVEILGFVRDSPYRVAAVRVLEERNASEGPAADEEKRRLLIACSGLLQETAGQAVPPLVLDGDIPFAVAVNTLCQNLAMDPEIKQGLLAMDDVVERCRALTGMLHRRWEEIALHQVERGQTPQGGVH